MRPFAKHFFGQPDRGRAVGVQSFFFLSDGRKRVARIRAPLNCRRRHAGPDTEKPGKRSRRRSTFVLEIRPRTDGGCVTGRRPSLPALALSNSPARRNSRKSNLRRANADPVKNIRYSVRSPTDQGSFLVHVCQRFDFHTSCTEYYEAPR